jgi:hypothetical protein
MKNIRFLLLATPFLLSACGEGWEMVRTDKLVPYGNTRTAGTGVAYVLAKMMPKKDVNLKSVERPAVPAAETEKPKAEEKPADKVFEDKQKK